jgi:hypothetical protein
MQEITHYKLTEYKAQILDNLNLYNLLFFQYGHTVIFYRVLLYTKHFTFLKIIVMDFEIRYEYRVGLLTCLTVLGLVVVLYIIT